MSCRADPLLDALSDGVCIADSVFRVLYMNRAARRMLGVTEGGGIGRNSCEVVCSRLYQTGRHGSCVEGCALLDPASHADSVTFSGRHGPHQTIHWRDDRYERRESWSHLRVRCLRARSHLWDLGVEERHFILIEDVSAEHELERRKEEWRGMIAHDLRSPLTTIIATLRLAQETPAGAELDATLRALLDAGVAAGRRMNDMIELFLDEGMLERGELRAARERVELLPILLRAEEQQAARAREAAVALTAGGDPSAAAVADPVLVERIVQNLLDNALKYTPPGGVIAAEAGVAENEAFLAVRDTGPGIPAERARDLFDPAHAGQAAPGRGAGHGLGLAFCRVAAEAMGGSIAAISSAGRGAELVVRLPLAGAP